MNVSVVLNYQITDQIKAKFAIDNLKLFIENQGLEVIRSVWAKFVYRSNADDEPSLLANSNLIGVCMRKLLQERCEMAGVLIHRMELMEFSYHVEVA